MIFMSFIYGEYAWSILNARPYLLSITPDLQDVKIVDTAHSMVAHRTDLACFIGKYPST